MVKDGLIFSNRFEQPDIDELLKEMEQNLQGEKSDNIGSVDDFFSFFHFDAFL